MCLNLFFLGNDTHWVELVGSFWRGRFKFFKSFSVVRKVVLLKGVLLRDLLLGDGSVWVDLIGEVIEGRVGEGLVCN